MWVHVVCIAVQLTKFLNSLCYSNPTPQPPHRTLHASHVQNSFYEWSYHTIYRTVISLLDNRFGRLQGSVILQLVGLQWSSAVFLKLGSAEPRRSEKGSQGLGETKMRNGGRVILPVPHLYVRTAVRVATFVTNHYVTDSTLTVNRCCSPEASWFCSPFGQQLATDSRCVMWDDAVDLSLWFFKCNVHWI